MEYQKIANLIDDASNQPSKFRTKNWVEINDESRGTYNANSEIKFKTTILAFKLRTTNLAYVIIVMHIFLLKELLLLIRLLLQMLMQIILIKK